MAGTEPNALLLVFRSIGDTSAKRDVDVSGTLSRAAASMSSPLSCFGRLRELSFSKTRAVVCTQSLLVNSKHSNLISHTL